MTEQLFFELWKDALAQKDKEIYIAEYGYPDFFDNISKDPKRIYETLGTIHDIAHISVREILQRSGLTQSSFSVKFCIPIRTVEDWATGKRKCLDYLRLMFCKELGLLKISDEGEIEIE